MGRENIETYICPGRDVNPSLLDWESSVLIAHRLSIQI